MPAFRFYIGLDLGQAQDYTALCVLEAVDRATGRRERGRDITEAFYNARHLERLRLGTTYPNIVARMKAITLTPELAGHYICVADSTGVGRPVVDMLTAAGIDTIPVTITGGTSVNLAGGYHVPKRDLVSAVQVMLQKGRLRFAEGLPEVPMLIKEMLSFQVKITEAANDTYGAWREGAHDDLVLSVALAAWFGLRTNGPLD